MRAGDQVVVIRVNPLGVESLTVGMTGMVVARLRHSPGWWEVRFDADLRPLFTRQVHQGDLALLPAGDSP